MNRVFASLTLAVALAASACGGSPSPSMPSPRPAPAAEPTPPPASRPSPPPARPEAPEPMAHVAADRWWYGLESMAGVPGAGVIEAHELLAGRRPARQVVVAVIDGGVDIQHEDLDGVLWVNEGEIAGNGLDDDGNGYVDDIHGWNFIGGADGRDVEFDTYEATRLHAACTGRGAAGATPRPDAATCREAAAAYEAEHEEMTAIADQIAQIQQIYPVIVQVLTQAVGQAPTAQNVAALKPSSPQIAQAQEIYLQLAALDLDEEALADQAKEVGVRLQYGLDLDYDPRPIVGDDYADARERVYGNADVEGPDPGHGTAVASVIAAERDNGLGIDGVADGVRIMSVRTVPNGDERDKDVANAIRYAVDNGAMVLNMSFGKDFSPFRGVVDEAIRYATDHGVLMVHASGNDGEDLEVAPNFPDQRMMDGSRSPLWLEVGASGWAGPDSLAASFGNYGNEEVDLLAPGVAILSAAPDDDYEPADGTSLAAPVVSGVAALLLAYFPDLTPADVRRILLETTTDVRDRMVARPGAEPGSAMVRFGDLSITGGIVNAAAAVRRASMN